MRRSVLTIVFLFAVLFGGLSFLNAQDQPAPKKDTVNMDTYAKPEFYYATEDEGEMEDGKGANTTVIVIAVAVIVVAGVVVMAARKRKK